MIWVILPKLPGQWPNNTGRKWDPGPRILVFLNNRKRYIHFRSKFIHMSDNPGTVKTYDWSRFTKRISIKSDKKKIYHAIASQSGLEKWFLRKAQFKYSGKLRSRGESIEIGDEYESLWH